MAGDMGRGAERLVIEHRAPLLEIRDALATERVFSTSNDSRPSISNAAAPDAVVYPAKWKKQDRLVTTRETAMGATVTETYELAAEGRQLLVTVEIEGSGPKPKLKFRRVYDREDDAGSNDESGS